MPSSESTRPSSADSPWRVADMLAEGLARLGARHIFGMPGSHTTTLYDALARRPELQTILTRNEQAGAFLADGYARVTGRPGIICTTAGPGATNALTGLGEAWADSVPVMLLTGQVNADRMHLECGAYHEIDLEGILRPVTLVCGTVVRPDQAGLLLEKAWHAMTVGRPRPTAIILPQDVMKFPAGECVVPPTGEVVLEPPRASASDLDRATEILSRAALPIILAGGGAVWGGAAEVLLELAIRLGAPVVTSLNGKGIVDETNPISLGHARSRRARVALEQADAMLAVGCRFTEVMTGWRTMPVPESLVQIDLDPSQIGMNHPAALGLVADAREAISGLLHRLPPSSTKAWGPILEQARQARPSQPEWLIETLQEHLPAEAPVFTDACEIGYRMQSDYLVRGPRRFFYPSNFIALGWGFPAALGAAVGLGSSVPVVSVSGDGGFLMTSQELATAARYRLRVIAIVHNDSTYGAIKNIQKRDHSANYRDVELNNPDFLALAGAFGVAAARASEPITLGLALREALERDGPTVIEVPDQWRPIRAGA